MSDLLKLSRDREFLERDGALVLVTLVAVEGSGYRRPGARLLVRENDHRGLISGGCLEVEVARRCGPLLAGESKAFGIALDTRQYLGCDGRLKLWCEIVPRELFEQVRDAADQRRPVYCSTSCRPGEGTEISDSAESETFVETILPPRRVCIFGATPDTKPLIRLVHAMDWKCETYALISDPLNGEADRVLRRGEDIQRLGIDTTTACVVMNHHFGRDLEILQNLWDSPTPFVGLLGSRKRRDQLLEKLAFDSRHQLDVDSRQLYAPVGLDLLGEKPEEIALEICAQIQKILGATCQRSISEPSSRNTATL